MPVHRYIIDDEPGFTQLYIMYFGNRLGTCRSFVLISAQSACLIQALYF